MDFVVQLLLRIFAEHLTPAANPDGQVSPVTDPSAAPFNAMAGVVVIG
ncbi:hypothetical protein ABZ470_10070 [Streptosporangium sp. NPDC020072]